MIKHECSENDIRKGRTMTNTKSLLTGFIEQLDGFIRTAAALEKQAEITSRLVGSDLLGGNLVTNKRLLSYQSC